METTLKQVAQNRLEQKFAKGHENTQAMIIQLQNELDSSRDFLAPFNKKENGDGIQFSTNGHLRMDFQQNTMPIHPHAVTQLATRLGIPTAYLRELADGEQGKRDLAATILNSTRQWTDDRRFLIRSVDNEVRGILSDSYKRIDSKMIVNSFLKELANPDSQALIADALFTPTKYWIEALVPYVIDIPTEKNGMVHMVFGVRLGNSDFGDGSLDIRSFMLQPICSNGAVRESMMNKVHLGSRLGDTLMLSQETYAHESKMMASAVKDVTRQALNSGQIRNNIALIQSAANTSVSLDREFLRLATQQVSKGEIVEIQKILTQDNPDDGVFGEATLWKLAQGITAHGRTVGGRREKELAQIAGELLQTKRLDQLQIAV